MSSTRIESPTSFAEEAPTMVDDSFADWFYCMNSATGERYHANSKARIQSKVLDGELMFMVRDDSTGNTHPAVKKYFANKKRRFDLQIQFRMKQPPTGTFWYGMEFSKPGPAGVVTDFLIRSTIKFVKLMNPGSFHCDVKKGTMAFLVDKSMDRVVITKPGSATPPPTLGEAIVESKESIQKRAAHGNIDWNAQDTYTTSCFSAYFDFLKWQVMSMPGLPPVDLRKLLGDQHFRFVVYYGEPGVKGTSKVLSLELSNAHKITPGPRAMDNLKQI